MKLTTDDVVAEWKEDSNIDETRLLTELTKTPMLHAKYLEALLSVKRKLINSTSTYNKLKYDRKKYFRGEMSREELVARGWDQYQGLKMSQTEFNSMSDIDPILNDEWIKLEYWKGLVQGIEFIMKEINNRHWMIRTMIDYNKMISGG